MADILKYNLQKLKKHQSYYTTTHTHSDNLFHSHENFWEIIYQIHGNTTNIVNGVQHELKPCELLIMPPKTIHSIYFQENSLERDIYCEDDILQSICSLLS